MVKLLRWENRDDFNLAQINSSGKIIILSNTQKVSEEDEWEAGES